MSDSLYVKVGSTMEALDLGTGTAPEYVERIEALESGLETVSTEALGVKADTVLAAQNAADVSGGSLGTVDLNEVLGAYEMARTQISALESSKADVSLANLSAAGKKVAAKASMPSGRYVNMSVGASGVTYTSPANGWWYTDAPYGNSNYCIMRNATTGHTTSAVSNAAAGQRIMMPVRKDDTVSFEYNVAPFAIRFIYAEGEEA